MNRNWATRSRRLALSVAGVVLIITAFALPASARTVTGTLTTVIADDFEHRKTSYSFYVQTAGHRQVVVTTRGAGKARSRALRKRLLSLRGKRVRITGRTRAGMLAVRSVRPLRERVSRDALASILPGNRKVAVIMFNFTNDTSQPFTATEVRDAVFGGTYSANAFLKENSSNANSFVGKVSTTGDVFGWYTINDTGVNPDGSCVNDTKNVTWATAARAAAQAAGKDLSGYDHFIYLHPHVCGGAPARGDAPGDEVWLNGYLDSRILNHELGHNLGPWHANSLVCKSNGVRVAISADCTAMDYGDPFSVMGYGTDPPMHHHNNHKTFIEFMPGANTQDVAPTAGGTAATINPSTTIMSAGTTQMVRIARQPGADRPYYYLEFRRPGGTFETWATNSPVVNGVSIRSGPAIGTPEEGVGEGNDNTVLIDATPDTSTFDDAPLALNKYFYDPLQDFTITTTAVSSTSATVSVKSGPPPITFSTVSVNASGTLIYSGILGLIDTPTLSHDGRNYVVENHLPLTAGNGCRNDTAARVTCSDNSITSYMFDLKDKPDGFINSTSLAGTVDGGAGNDSITGGSAAETVVAGDGDDTIDGGLGADAVDGGSGVDEVTYATRTAAVTVTLDGSPGDGVAGENDNLATTVEDVTGGTAADNITGSGVSNVIRGGGGSDTLSGSYFADELYGEGGNDTLNGGEGDDDLDGGSGADAFNGGGGVDLVPYWERSAAVTVTIDGVANDGESGEGDNVKTDVESVYGGAGNDTLTGSTAANKLYGNMGADTLNGGDGNDTIDPGPGVDVLNGGNGIDAADYDWRSDPLTITIDGTANDGESGEGDNVKTDVESVYGGEANDTITGSSADNILVGNAGNDTLNGGAGNDRLEGGDGADVLSGGTGAGDTVTYASATAGVTVTIDDVANDAGTDNVKTDNEILIGSPYADTLTGSTARNDIYGGNGNDTLNGGADTDVLFGQAGNDTLNGGTGGDRLDGGTGADAMNGDADIDTADYRSRTAAITVTLDASINDGESGESDIVRTEGVDGGSGSDSITGDVNANTLRGGAGNDTISGGGGNDRLEGEAGTDTLNGGDGDDSLEGGAGADAHNGDAGRDWATYATRTLALNVSLDNSANDGESGEGDNVKTENVTLGAGADYVVGDAYDNILYGMQGNDYLTGGLGNDRLVGHEGRDNFQGGFGVDILEADDDVVDGTISCGPDATDTAYIDLTGDVANTDCESVIRR